MFLLDEDQEALIYLRKSPYFYTIWNSQKDTISLKVDHQDITLEQHQVLFLTYNQKIDDFTHPSKAKVLMFNREFFCVHTYDEEVSCNGLLFFGSDFYPILKLPVNEINRFQILMNVLAEEFTIADQNQEEMLRILLKRLLIRSTRLARNQFSTDETNDKHSDLIRKFNVLVEEHFRTKKTVKSYADLLFKSPKTLSNIFSKLSDKTPLQIIHNRIIIEAKRYLSYTNISVQEISDQLNFEDASQFSRFFKNKTQVSPNKYRKNLKF